MKAPLVLTLTALLLFGISASCKKSDPDECDDSVVPTEPIAKAYEFAQPQRLGDSIKMRVFKREPIDSFSYAYEYLGTVELVATDSTETKVYQQRAIIYDCQDEYLSVHRTITFTGDSTLTVKLMSIIGDAYLGVYFADKEFLAIAGALNRGGEDIYKPSMQVNGNWYDNVNLLKGFDRGNWGQSQAYTDSTYLFYNASHGIIRFVINDRFVLERL